MKRLFRSVVYHIFALWLTSTLIPSLSISGNLWGMFSAGTALALMMIFLKPLISLLFLPINILTLGLLSWLVNVVVLYVWSVFVPNVSITPWVFPGFNMGGFALPSVPLSFAWTLVVIAIVIVCIVSAIERLDE